MKHLLATLSLVIAVAATTAVVAYRLSGDGAVRDALAKRDALEWLRADFQLTDAQFAQIRKLHESYSSVCEEHCREIQAAERARQTLPASASAETIAAAERRVQELRRTCETAIATHVRQVAACMAPDQGERYLKLVLPKIADFDHKAPPDVGLEKRPHH